ncbi:peptidylprolyl isomerase [Erythrobacter sp. SD-21]|uniref:peptidylprolyl isomerase n=1 Tax=Erythrobacter sp. SD-21 TaxID=161528 RepID=UPI000153F28C|nr:peptidylprolyl isomerase [Erythrobacter sp. SD-21]EDL49293.1 peptidyl-prolyl cis-trans isomerase [Erythrobacter sp. SD-21]
MTKPLISLATALALALPAFAPALAQEKAENFPSPGEIVETARAEEWIAIPAEDLVVMTLAPDADGSARKVIIQLMPAPFGEAWTANIRTFARSGWFDDITVNRVQDNYVVQWGDANYDNPESDGEPKGLPVGLRETSEGDYAVAAEAIGLPRLLADSQRARALETDKPIITGDATAGMILANGLTDPYAQLSLPYDGWPLASNYGEDENEGTAQVWPVHCYGMVGVGRNYSPDAGTGAELYTVIGHAPRHLDRNIALVGRIVEGMEHLSSLPRGKGTLGFYEDENKRTPILTVRVAADLPEDERPVFEYLDTSGETFARYADARANRRDPFFNVAAGGVDICNIPVPIRRVAE